MPIPTPNTDESLAIGDFPFIGNFHKTLPHNDFGEVIPAAYRQFERTCTAIEAGEATNFDAVPTGPLNVAAAPAQSPFNVAALPALTRSTAKFTSPMAGASTETHGLDPRALEMIPAPQCQGVSAAAEMVELYWMALLRDAPLLAFQDVAAPPGNGCAALGAHNGALGYDVVNRTAQAVQSVNVVFDQAVGDLRDPGRLRVPLDGAAGAGAVPGAAGVDIRRQTVFRGGLPGEQFGPLVSQFFLHPIGYGTQTINQQQTPYIARQDFLTSHGDWLLAQNTGKDRFGRDYANCNNYSDQQFRGANYYPVAAGVPVQRGISTMRDLARFVNRDALHQAYFNAALFLLGVGAPLDAGNPYRGNRNAREGGFATLGDPDLLTLVSEVASRALKVVWRQKWLVHRRCRPEVMGGLIQMQRNGFGGERRAYGLSMPAAGTPFGAQLDVTLNAVAAHNAFANGGGANAATLFLPMAFSAGSPPHPAYGAGHATVAGACVTVLKAWFDEDATLFDVYAAAAAGNGPKDPPGGIPQLLQPGYRRVGASLEEFCPTLPYNVGDSRLMTVGGELNKIASNVAMGRSMGGVHWRSDNTRSLRLGEQIGIEILRKRTAEYAERPTSFTFRSFDGPIVTVSRGQVE